MADLYNKLGIIVSKNRISNDLYVRHAYSRNVTSNLQGIPEIVIFNLASMFLSIVF